MAKTVLYQLPTDNVAATYATLAVTSGATADTEYPPAYLVDLNVAKPAKLTNTTGGWVFGFSSAQRVDLVALGPHNIDAGATVQLQGNATDSWGGTPTLNTTITIPAAHADGHRVTAWKDLTGVSGYSTSGFAFWRINVSTTNSAPIALGEVWLGSTKRAFDRNYQWSYETADMRRLVEHYTEYGVATVYDLMVRLRRFRALVRASDAGLVDLRAWHRAARGRVKPVLFVPDADVNEALWVRLTQDLAATSVFTGVHDVQLDLDELAPGLPL